MVLSFEEKKNSQAQCHPLRGEKVTLSVQGLCLSSFNRPAHPTFIGLSTKPLPAETDAEEKGRWRWWHLAGEPSSPRLLLLTRTHPFHLSSFMAPSGMWRLVSAGAQLQELPGFWRWWNEPMWRIYCSSVSTRESLQPSVAKGKQCDIQEVCFCSKRK